ncbi:MAG: CbiX/SirB N-terminal domain-containing protein [Gammaproteobacteria bacterium]|jgi:sirohydrochlorin ferrochelatase
MKAMLIVAHGSRREASNDEIRELARSVARRAENSFDRVSCAFLELAEPNIPDGLRELIRDGVRNIVVMPYFLSAGRHVAEDIPGEVDLVRGEFPDVTIGLAPYLGLAHAVPDLLLQQAAIEGARR